MLPQLSTPQIRKGSLDNDHISKFTVREVTKLNFAL